MTERDPFYGAELEEEVLSSMLQGRKVTSLEPEHFTHPMRSLLYALLKRGVAYVDLDQALKGQGVPEEERAYVTDVFMVDSLGHEALMEAVADLKRLARLRPFVADVEAWLRKAPHLTYEKAVTELGAIIRQSGSRVLGQNESAPPSPR